MCAICNHFPCLTGCPNEGVSVIMKCDNCHSEICDGDQYAVIDGEAICYDCLSDMSVSDWIEKLGTELVTAGEE